MTTLKGKTLFITGGSRGIGLAIALRAARDGANVAIAAKTVEPHPKLPGTIFTAAEEIEAAGGKALPLQVDIREETQVYDAVAKTVETFGGIDVLVNNASAINLTGTLETPIKRYDLMQGVNARGTFLCSQACIPHLKKAGQPAHPDLVAAAIDDAALVRAACRLHHGEIRHEHVRARHGRGVPRGRHRGQCAVAAHHHRDRGLADDPRRQGRVRPHARRSWPTPPTSS